MWDNPTALNRLSRLILAATALFVLWVAGRALLEMSFPFRQVTVEGSRHDSTRVGAEAMVSRMRGGFFSMDLTAVQADFLTLPWVRRADVHRVWPGRLVVTLEEHQAFAAWNDQASMNSHGEIFAVEPAAGLPRLYAPEGMEKLVFRRYDEFNRIVAPLDTRVEQVVVSARQSWRVRLGGGISVELGRERINERLSRFAQVYPQAVAAVGPIHRVDMRYPNGFAAQVESAAAPSVSAANKASKA
ncbi:MAG: cell division protein FtsQ/DivIB [Pseudomonadota bacterium]